MQNGLVVNTYFDIDTHFHQFLFRKKKRRRRRRKRNKSGGRTTAKKFRDGLVEKGETNKQTNKQKKLTD